MFIKRGPRRAYRQNSAANQSQGAAGANKGTGAQADSEQRRSASSAAKQSQNTAAGRKRAAKPLKKPRAAAKASASASRREADRAAERAQRERAPQKTRRRRRGSMIIYYIIGLILAVIVLIILANTLLFNCDKILVEGNVSYSYDQVVSASAVPMGKNILHIDTHAAAERVVASLDYIDIAEVERIFPTGIKITVQEAEEWFSVKQGGGAATVSRRGKIIADKIMPDIPVVYGYTVERLVVGEQLVSIGEGKQDIPADVLNAADNAGLSGFIKEIDMNDRFSIILHCDDDIIIKLGNVHDLEQKFEVAKAILAENEGLADITVSVVNPSVGYMHRNDSVIVPVLPENSETSESGETQETVTE